MVLETLDWLIIGLFLAISLGIGIYFRKRAQNSIADFFLGGRNFPWYLAGISMVATTFAADTPLAVTELVAQNGISGNWLWWSFLFGGMLTTFFFAKLWRRANILTEIELIELRYSGIEAAILRGFKSVYLGLFMNVLIIGWVNVALNSLLIVFFDIPPDQAIWYTAGAMLIAAAYSSLSGLWGVAVTDVVQFAIAMIGTVTLAVIVVNSDQVGGIDGMKEQLPNWAFDFFPKIGTGTDTASALTIGIGAFLAYSTVQWWSSWYPGAEPGGGGYVAQRMMAAKDEKSSIYATLFFQVAHYCIRPWPWILVGLASLILYPDLAVGDEKLGYVMAMKDFLPTGLKGLLLVAFLAAYMSTISTQLNWGAGYLVNDFYKRFISPDAPEKRLVAASRITTIIIMAVALIATTFIETISGVWTFIIEAGAGLGLVLILRWYWWRINAWSEIAATITPFIGYGLSKYVFGWEFPNSFFFIVGTTTLVWIIVTYLTKPTAKSTLINFYNKVQPDGNWKGLFSSNTNWGNNNVLDEPTEEITVKEEKSQIGNLVICWLSAVVFTYSTLFFTGKFIFKEWTEAGIWFGVAIFAMIILRLFMKKTKIL